MELSARLLWVFAQVLLVVLETLAGQGCPVTCQGGIIQSPNYPHDYNNNLNLEWTLTAPPGQNILLNISDLFLECGYDYLEVFDGNDYDSTRIARYCSLDHQTVIASPGNILYITFTTDDSVTRSGFSLEYFCLDCNKNLTNPTGEISSPLYPDSYMDDASCSWHIRAPEGQQILLNFTYINTECGYDYVTGYDGSSVEASQLFHECTLPDESVFLSSANQMLITFTSDSSTVFPGFLATYTFYTCGGVLKDSEGVFTSYNYPSSYYNNLNCEWTILSGEGFIIELTLDFVDTECHRDDVTVYNGSTKESGVLGRYCREYPVTIHTNSSVILVTFHTDSSVVAQGFHATYSSNNCASDDNDDGSKDDDDSYGGEKENNNDDGYGDGVKNDDDDDEYSVGNEDSDEDDDDDKEDDRYGDGFNDNNPDEDKDDDGYGIGDKDDDGYGIGDKDDDGYGIDDKDDDGYDIDDKNDDGYGVEDKDDDDDDGYGDGDKDDDGYGVGDKDDDGYGIEDKDDDGYDIDDKDDDGYGVEDKDDDGYGVVDKDDDGYGVGDKDDDGYGVVDKDDDGYGIVDKDDDGYVIGDKEDDGYGVGDKEDDGYGVGDKEDDGYGENVDDKDIDNYGDVIDDAESKSDTNFGSDSTDNDSDDDTDEDYDKDSYGTGRRYQQRR
uniref:CUB domain-containing protein n=1 Tax=Biomphalaria glabrata TaxID=6526 RepID=A0A2C9LSN8_BIOGL